MYCIEKNPSFKFLYIIPKKNYFSHKIECKRNIQLSKWDKEKASILTEYKTAHVYFSKVSPTDKLSLIQILISACDGILISLLTC